MSVLQSVELAFVHMRNADIWVYTCGMQVSGSINWWWPFRASKDFGRMFDNSFPACAFFFFSVEISLRTLIPLFMPGLVHSGSASC